MPLPAVLVDVVAGIVDDVGVVASASRASCFRAVPAVEHVGAGVAGDDVVEGVAGAVDVAGAKQREVLDRAKQAGAVAETEAD